MKIPERLQPLVEQGIVQEVLRPLMSGKEAQLFIVKANDDFCVAKVYKDAQHRSFRQKTVYMEGRRSRNSRQQRAIEKGSKFGKEQAEEAWQESEVAALYRLFDVGVRVPRPHVFTDGVLLMDLILDEDGRPAPRLFDVDLSEEEATKMHLFLVRQSVWMLCAGLVHGDLSECNVLLAWDGPMIIDFPQATDAAQNANAKSLFVRDIDNLTRYFARFAPEIAATKYGEEIWGLYERAQLFPDSRLTGTWRGSDRRADTRSVLREIETAARDAQRKREIDGGKPINIHVDARAMERELPRDARSAPRDVRGSRDAQGPRDLQAPRRDSRPAGRDARPFPRDSGTSVRDSGPPPRDARSNQRDGRGSREPDPAEGPSAALPDLDDLDAFLLEE